MDKQVERQTMYGRRNGLTIEKTAKCMDVEMDIQVERQTSVWMEYWTDMRKYRQVYGRKNGHVRGGIQKRKDGKREERKGEGTVKEKNKKANGL